MANKLVETTLNDLLNGELRAHHAYLQAAAWAAERNLDGCYKFLLGHAAEELEHMHRIFSFLNDLELQLFSPSCRLHRSPQTISRGCLQLSRNTNRVSPPPSTRRLISRGLKKTMRPHPSCNGS